MGDHIGAIDQGTTALGDPDQQRWAEDKRWEPAMDDEEWERQYARWKQAVQRSLGWVQ
jgi:glycerol kinase